MSRPSTNTDKRMIEAAKALIPQTGFKGLRIRDVARKAGVNLGMFNYYFKTKEKFIEILLTELYGEFLNTLEIETQEGGAAREHLKNALEKIGVFIRDHRHLVFPLFEEIVSGNREIMEFAKINMSKHFFILFDLIKKCQKEGSISKNIPIPAALLCLIVPVAIPNLAMKAFEKYYSKTLINILTKPFQSMFLSDMSIKQRVEIVLKGVSPGD
ncbi:MAG: TetR/AcrR family transcriptional regulator [Elusimicrobia bacterium]|nr:TetR/AcrR family transcriptional regulator [Elusimicrobiota bacterium]